MSKKVAIVQSNYIPWKGYFDLIASVDEFVLYDDMQYTKRDWRNRNKIKTANGTQWLSIPVESKSKYFQTIRDTKISDSSWNKKHWKSISQAYSKAPHFKDYKEIFEDLYANATEQYLSEINYKFITAINAMLGIKTTIRWSNDFQLAEGKNEKLLGICKDLGADTYISGPAAKDYLDNALFENDDISVEWASYDGYPEYQQQFNGFEHGVTILDLLFNCGSETVTKMKYI